MPRKKSCALERVGTGEQEENENAQQLPSDESHRAISRRNGRLLRTEADTTSKKNQTSPSRNPGKSNPTTRGRKSLRSLRAMTAIYRRRV